MPIYQLASLKTEARHPQKPMTFVPASYMTNEETRTYLFTYLIWLAIAFLLTSGFREQGAWLSSWVRWDSEWYQKIWQEGYNRQDPRALVFPPGYSITVGVLSLLLPIGFQLVSLVVNLSCFFVGSCLAAQFLGRRFNLPPLLIFISTLSAPTAYFVFTIYSDALFYLMFWAAIVLVHSKSEHVAIKASRFALLLFLPWIRMTGYALSIWVLFRRRLVIPLFLSLSGWFALNYLLAGDPFYFLKAQLLFSMPQGSFLAGLRYSVGQLIDGPGQDLNSWTDYLQFSLLPLIYLAALGSVGLWLCWKREWALGLAVLGILFMSHNQSFWRSAVRYDLPLAPVLFLPVAKIAQKSLSRERIFVMGACLGAIIFLQFGLQIYFGNLIKSGAWGF